MTKINLMPGAKMSQRSRINCVKKASPNLFADGFCI